MDEFEPLLDVDLQKEEESPPSVSYWRASWRRLKRDRVSFTALSILAFLFLMAIIGPWLTPYSYTTIHLPLKNSLPCAQFWFGSDELGRDIFTRIWWGARISFLVGLTAAAVNLCLGVSLGAIAGWMGKKIDEVMMRATDILHSLPYLLLVTLLTVIIGPSLLTIILALVITDWIPMARIVRGQILQLKELDYAQAAYALGASRHRILFRHLLPNALGVIITTATLTIPRAIFTEAFLSFLGLGVQAPIASWGVMASDGLSSLSYFPWRLLIPAAFISLTMLSFNLLGDGLHDALDPRLSFQSKCP